MSSSRKRVARAHAQGMRIGLFRIDEQAMRRLLRLECEAAARDLFPEPTIAKEIMEKALMHADRKRCEALATADGLAAGSAARAGTGGVALALAAGASLGLVLHGAGLGAVAVIGAGAAVGAWLMLCLPALPRVADQLWHRAVACAWERQGHRIERRLAARDAALRRRREYMEAEVALVIAALAAGIAEGTAAAPAIGRAPAESDLTYHKGAILDVVQ